MNNYEKNEEKLKNLNNWRQKLKTFWEKNKKVEIKKMNKISFDKNWGKVGEKLRKSWQVMSPHYSDQMSQRSQMSLVALCMSKVKVLWVSEWVSQWVSDKVTYWAVVDS